MGFVLLCFQEGEEEPPQPKALKVPPEVKPKPQSPPPVAPAAASPPPVVADEHDEDDEGDKIMAELQVGGTIRSLSPSDTRLHTHVFTHTHT